jgi:ribosomal protein L21E
MRIEMNGMVIEGTVEELREIGVKFPVDEEETQAPKFEVGDYARVIAEGLWRDIEVGSIVKIVGPKDKDGDYKAELLDGSDYDYFRDEHLEKVTVEEVEQAKAKTQPNFKVGDYVKLSIKDGKSPKYGWGDAKNGDIGKIVEIRSDGTIKVDFPNHEGWNGVSHELVPATDEEVAQAKEEARWAKIGRKPGEFKKGDIVRVIDSASSRIYNGEIGVLGEKDFDGTFRVFVRDVTEANWHGPQRLELICPVEQRFDLAAEGARQ